MTPLKAALPRPDGVVLVSIVGVELTKPTDGLVQPGRSHDVLHCVLLRAEPLNGDRGAASASATACSA
ncbi:MULTISPECIES: hypothetical protein [Streptomyces]|uniref:hypothetical protein n=1 Tax=Streptomyces lycopersici TaxID=2974589 RepID=UPI0021CF3B15|nr:hypothetical protein [Streptomyces sp. NEAU-383]